MPPDNAVLCFKGILQSRRVVVILLVFGTGDGGSTPLGTIFQIIRVNYMENILVVGINTRPVACSLKKIGYRVYSVDYFGSVDLQECAANFRSYLKQKPYQSCGNFIQNFKSDVLVDLAADFTKEADGIICLAGVSPENFPKKKIIGNKNIKNVEDKYKLYKTLKKEFKLPLTYLISDVDEAREIIDNFPQKKFILKPRTGDGGYGIIPWENRDNHNYHDYILQEYLKGDNISVSLLSTPNVVHTTLTSQQIIGQSSLGQKQPYGYCGNIAPLLDDKDASRIAEQVIEYLALIGSNGVDFVLQGDEIFVIEVNPRLQGTFECAELVLGINLAQAHLEACQGKLMKKVTPKEFGVKMIVFARRRSLVGELGYGGVYDIPQQNVIIEEGEPVATVLKTNKVLENAIHSAEITVNKINQSLKPL